jgi:hypothetical protein
MSKPLLRVYCTKCNVHVTQKADGSMNQRDNINIYNDLFNDADVDITESHDAIMHIINGTTDNEMEQSDILECVHTIVNLGLLKEYQQNIVNMTKKSNATWYPINSHVLLLNPYLLLPVLSESSIPKLVNINYNWVDYTEYIVKIAIRMASTATVVKILDSLEAHYQIDCRSVNLDFMLEYNYDAMKVGEHLFDKIFHLLEVGFTFDEVPVLSVDLIYYAVINNFIDNLMSYGLILPDMFKMKLDQINFAIQNGKIDKLIECGLNVRLSIDLWHRSHINTSNLDIFLKAYPEFAGDVFKTLIYDVNHLLNHIMLNHNVDPETMIREADSEN